MIHVYCSTIVLFIQGNYSLIDFTVSPAAILEEYIQKKGGWVSNYYTGGIRKTANILRFLMNNSFQSLAVSH